MVAIPKSFGVIQRPTTQTGQAEVNPSYNQILPNAISNLGSQVQNASFQLRQQQAQEEFLLQRQQQKEQEAFNAAQLLDFKTRLSKIDNEAELNYKNLPSSNINEVDKIKNTLLENRKNFVNQESEKFKNNPTLLNLIQQQANTSSVDIENNLATEYSRKQKDFGVNKIYESIYNVNTQIASGRNVANAKKTLDETLQFGLRSGLIDMKDVIREKEKQQQLVKQREKELEEKVAFNTVINKKTYLDPNNSRNQKIIDSNFAKSAQTNKNPEQLAFDLSVNTGIIPSQFKNVLSGRLAIGSPKEQLQSAKDIIDMVKRTPSLENQFTSDELKFVNEIKGNLEINLPAEQIVKYARDNLSKISSLDKKARNDLYENKDYKKQLDKNYKDLQSKLRDEAGFDMFKTKAEIPPQLELHYKQLVKNAIVSDGMTPEGAIRTAEDKIKKEWAITSIGAKRVQRGAPEAFYGIYGNTDWIKGQLSNTITTYELNAEKPKLDNYALEPIPQSIINNKPSYYIQKQNQYGMSEFLMDSKNQPVIFTPNFFKTEEAKKAREKYDLLNKSLNDEELLNELKNKNFSQEKLDSAILLGSKLGGNR
jgi:hypothetical protein